MTDSMSNPTHQIRVKVTQTVFDAHACSEYEVMYDVLKQDLLSDLTHGSGFEDINLEKAFCAATRNDVIEQEVV